MSLIQVISPGALEKFLGSSTDFPSLAHTLKVGLKSAFLEKKRPAPEHPCLYGMESVGSRDVGGWGGGEDGNLEEEEEKLLDMP